MDFDPARVVRREALFGGVGSVLVQALEESPLPAPFTTVLLCELSPGGRVGAHVQQTDSEIVVGLAGEAVLYVDGLAHALRPGGAAGLPLGGKLEIDNASAEAPFRYLIVKAAYLPSR
ncbi:MAG: cupin domain-containing protein [Polyangiaceae bacterium]|nr:cupin domain-containing protein [Polyangiaceae bacterium]MCE7889081.1 cupin domain-containing protein [Sorangiineae bacterium PRO1]MCL4755584.1 cupin domain-containing protein [Myxococcales bacterium]